MENNLELRRDSEIVEVLRDTSTLAKFREALDAKAVKPFVMSVITEVARRPELWSCEPESVMVSALQIALLRLSVEPALGHAYLVPFKDGRTGGKKCTKVVGYRGLKQLMIRTGMYESMNVVRVWEGERIEQDRFSGRVTIAGTPASLTTIVGRVAYFRMNDGYEKFLPMTTEEIHAHAKKFSPGYEMPGSFWKNKKAVGVMEEKTPFRLLVLRDGYLDPFDMSLVKEEEVEKVSGVEVSALPEPSPAPPAAEVAPSQNLRERIVKRAGELVMKKKENADSSERARLAIVLNQCFGDDPLANKRRSDALWALTGYRTVDGLPGATVRAMLWCLCRVTEGQFVLDESAAEEVRAWASEKWSS